MTSAEILRVIVERRKYLKKYYDRERKKLDRLRYKSVHVRRNAAVQPRLGLLKDHLNELDNIIGYLRGKQSKKEFLGYQIWEDFGDFFDGFGK